MLVGFRLLIQNTSAYQQGAIQTQHQGWVLSFLFVACHMRDDVGRQPPYVKCRELYVRQLGPSILTLTLPSEIVSSGGTQH
jgi:hypothetical protein